MGNEEIDVTEEELAIDIDSIDFSDIEKKFAPKIADPLEAILIVDNIPVVDEVKEPKLTAVLKKIFAKFGFTNESGMYMPMIPDAKNPGKQTSKGFLFLECESAEKAAEFAKQANGHRLDKNHVFAVNKFNEFEKLLSVPDEYVPPAEEEYKEKEHLTSWLTDEAARDQFSILAGDDLTVMWNNRSGDPAVEHRRANWTDSTTSWSPKGTYLATFHRQGIALWGGKSWERIVRFVHSNVKFIEFSPQENFMLTWSPPNPSATKDENLRVWDVKTGKLLRGFAMAEPKEANELTWPLMKWSPDEKYLARFGSDNLAVYDVPAMTLVGGKSLKVEGIVDIAWSPKDNLLAYWTPEKANTPARVTILDYPGKTILRTKNLFMVSACRMFWQSEGDYLAVAIDKYTKTKKNVFSTLEVFCMRERDIPIDVYEGFKDRAITALEWEPKGDKFATISAEGQKIFISFFKVEKASLKEINTFEKKAATDLFWSPAGRFIVIAALKNFQGELEFYDAEEMQSMKTGEHYQASGVQWDPSGIYVVSVSSSWRTQGETGYVMWDFRGQMIQKKNMPKFKHFEWRYRPASLLTKEQMKNIRKNLNDYSAKFDVSDSQVSGAVNEKAAAARAKIWAEWNAWRDECEARCKKDSEARAKLRGSEAEPIFSDNEEEEDETIEEWTEEVLEESEEIVQ